MRAAIGLALVAAGLAGPAAAEEGLGPVTKLPMPRYVSLNASEINVRRGPGLDYRIDWVFRRDGLPVRVIDEYASWRRIRDHEGEDGWVYHALISGRRTVLVTLPGVLLQREPGGAGLARPCDTLTALPAGAVACAGEGVVARLEACAPDWCRIETGGYAGWVPKTAIWGVMATEVFGD
ncbi:MAG: SH3 domain-containing protein [Pseudomonadota bacterium]